MEIYTDLLIGKFITKIRLSSNRTDNIMAFGELWAFKSGLDEKPIFKVKGFTLREKQFELSKEKVLSVVFPAYFSPKSKSKYQTSFVFEDVEILKKVRDSFLQEYSEISGGLPTRSLNEDINPDNIPF